MAKPATDEEKAQWVRAYQRVGRVHALGNLFGRSSMTIRQHLIDLGIYVDPEAKKRSHPWRQYPLVTGGKSAAQEGQQQQGDQQEHQGVARAREAAQAGSGDRAGHGPQGDQAQVTTVDGGQ
jgi:hypothetical protein